MNELCGVAISRLHISRDEFYFLTPIEFHYALKDFNEYNKINQRFELIKMRLQTFYLLNIQLSQESRYNSPEEMMPFEFDYKEPKQVLELTEEDWARLDRFYHRN